MKQVLIDNIIEDSDLTADEENANYPIENVLNEHPKLPWKATSTDGSTIEVEIDMPSAGNLITLFSVVSDTVVFELWDAGKTGLIETTTYDMDELLSYHEMTVGIPASIITSLWIDYTYQVGAHLVVLKFTAAVGVVAECGIMRGGITTVLPHNPQYGLNESLVDYSIKRQNANGSSYYNKRDIVRTFSGTNIMNRDQYFYVVMLDIAQTIGEEPIPWKITDIATDKWAVFARFEGMPSGSHILPTHSNISFTLLEVV